MSTQNPTSSGQDELREKIAKTLVKWHMPTRQIAIDEILLTAVHHTQEAVEAAYFRGLTKEQRSHKYNAGDVCKNCGVGGEDGAEYGEYWSCEQVRMARKLAALASTNQPKLNQGESDEPSDQISGVERQDQRDAGGP